MRIFSNSMEDRPSPDRQSPSEGIARSAAITSIAVGMSRVTGLVRETIM